MSWTFALKVWPLFRGFFYGRFWVFTEADHLVTNFSPRRKSLQLPVSFDQSAFATTGKGPQPSAFNCCIYDVDGHPWRLQSFWHSGCFLVLSVEVFRGRGFRSQTRSNAAWNLLLF